MSPQEQQVAIATACGWEVCIAHVFTSLPPHGCPPNVRQPTALELIAGTAPSQWDIPDYTSDLNAMYDAVELCINSDNSEDYDKNLRAAMAEEPDFIWHAKASQHAEAFLRTLGLWVESTQVAASDIDSGSDAVGTG